ncbi:MAG: hypothetical protein MUP85_10105 [Candidatus Lokiarchaeota archaeon]|nr:hypothetical protein [Candidatus Lokiarchaeota archaeon]
MQKLRKSSFNEASQFIKNHARPLEKLIYRDYFHKPCCEEILNELKKYQNDNGGFGNGLDLDFKLLFSSSMATSIAFQHLARLDDAEKAISMINSGIEYFEETFAPERNGWFAVPKEVNDFPHAPWWHYNEKEGMTIIDKYWGNPSAEIIGYLYKYKNLVSKLNVDQLLNYAIDYLNDKKIFSSEHEIYCFIRLFKLLPNRLSSKIENKLVSAVQRLVCNNRKEWEKYVPKPLNFVSDPESYKFGINHKLIEGNLDYLVNIIQKNGIICPNWEWNDYEIEWKKAREEWIGVLTLQALIILDKFSRIEK